jgi:hypothetical protein
MEEASLQLVLAPGAILPANAKAVRQKTETAVMSTSASFFIVLSSLTQVKHSVNQLFSGLKTAASSLPSNKTFELNISRPFLAVVGKQLYNI